MSIRADHSASPSNRCSYACSASAEKNVACALPHVRLVCLPEPLARVFADRLEHQEAVLADRLQEARVDERSDDIEVGLADLLGRGEREAARNKWFDDGATETAEPEWSPAR